MTDKPRAAIGAKLEPGEQIIWTGAPERESRARGCKRDGDRRAGHAGHINPDQSG